MDMKEKDYFMEMNRKESPFKVPEGYFERFHADIMSKIEEKPQKAARIINLRPLWYSAAMIAVVAVIITIAKFSLEEPANLAEEDGYIEQVMTYGVFDNQVVDDYICSIYE